MNNLLDVGSSFSPRFFNARLVLFLWDSACSEIQGRLWFCIDLSSGQSILWASSTSRREPFRLNYWDWIEAYFGAECDFECTTKALFMARRSTISGCQKGAWPELYLSMSKRPSS